MIICVALCVRRDDRLFCRERPERKNQQSKKRGQNPLTSRSNFSTLITSSGIGSDRHNTRRVLLKTTRSKPILNKKELFCRSNKMMMMCVRCCVITHLVLHFSTTLLNYVLLFLFAFFLIVVCLCRRVPVCVCVARSGVQKPPHAFLTSFFSIKHKKYRHLLFLFFSKHKLTFFVVDLKKYTQTTDNVLCSILYYY